MFCAGGNNSTGRRDVGKLKRILVRYVVEGNPTDSVKFVKSRQRVITYYSQSEGRLESRKVGTRQELVNILVEQRTTRE
jgi:hypothetical protein